MGDSLPYTQSACVTRMGSNHTENQDSYGIFDGSESEVKSLRRGVLYIICDGVSTLEMGQWAADMTCERMGQFFDREAKPTLDTLRSLVGEIDWELRGVGKGRAACTLSALWLSEGKAHVLAVGDSDVFLVRDDEVHRLTHSQVNKDNRRLSHYMGMGPSISEALRVSSEAFQPGDAYFLMTDGVTGLVEPPVLADAWNRSFFHPARCAETLLHHVEKLNGTDDATAIVVQILMLEDLPEEKTEEVLADTMAEVLKTEDVSVPIEHQPASIPELPARPKRR